MSGISSRRRHVTSSRRWVIPALSMAAVVAIAAPAIATLHGTDVASHQHPGAISIDWHAVKASGHDFAIVKATEGLSYVNPHYAEDSRAMQKAGLVRGTYHYALPQFPAIAQAQHYAAVLATHSTPLDLPPVLDIEETGGLSPTMLTNWVRLFVTTLDALTHRRTMIYTSPGFWRYQMGNTTEFSHRPLWIADYNGGQHPTLPLPGGWTRWTFWQYTGNGWVDGVRTPIDLNTFNGERADLFALTRQGRPSRIPPQTPQKVAPRKPTSGTSGQSRPVPRDPLELLTTGQLPPIPRLSPQDEKKLRQLQREFPRQLP